MALEESVDGLVKLEASGVTAHVEATFSKYIEGQGGIHIDHVGHESGGGGFMVTMGSASSCGSDSFSC
jgi:hypothetical protein